MTWNEEKASRYTLVSDIPATIKGLRRKILEALDDAPQKTLTKKQVVKAVKANDNSVRFYLGQLQTKKLIKKDKD